MDIDNSVDSIVCLSLFDGISCGKVALERAGIKITQYYASEINDQCIQVSKNNHPDIIHLGDINNWREWDLPKIDLIIGGSPCQGFSFAGKELNFDDPRSKLFFVFADIIKHYQPKHWLLENVVMRQSFQDVISSYMGVKPILINSNVLSAQTRKRLYWTNIPFAEPTDANRTLDDIWEGRIGKPARIVGRRLNERGKRDDYNRSIPIIQYLEVIDNKKSHCLTTVEKDSLVAFAEQGRHPNAYDDEMRKKWRTYTPVEYERLQTLPDNYTEGISNSARFKAIGNGWTVDVIAHILGGINNC